MLIQGSPDMLSPPGTPLAVGGLGYVDSVTPRTQYIGAPTDWDIFRDRLFFGNLANRNDPAHVSNIFGSYYDPQVWGASRASHQRNLIAFWKQILSGFTGATWNDVALAYGVPLTTIEQFVAAANADIFPVIRAVWQNPLLPDSIKRPALGLIVQTFGLTPWEWARVVGLDEATAVEVVNVPVPTVAATLQRNVSPAVQATATKPGFVVSTRTGEVSVIPAGSDPFTDAGFTNDVEGRRKAVLIYSLGNDRNELVFIDPAAPPSDRPIKPASLARLRDLLNMIQRLAGERARNITSDETPNFNRYLTEAGALAIDLGLTETELALYLGLTLEQFRSIYVFNAATFGIAETREAVTVQSELPALTAPSAQALEPVKPVFYFQFPAGFSDLSAEDKARFYLSMIAQGFTDAQIRITAESTFGAQPDASWSYLQTVAAALIAAEAAAAAAAAAAAVQTTAVTMQEVLTVQDAAQTANTAADTAAAAVVVAEQAATAQDTTSAANAAQVATTAANTADAAATTAATTAATAATTGVTAMIQLPANLGTMTEAQKIAWYRATLAAGNSDAAIRAAVEATYGKQSDSSWTYLRAKAAQAAPAGGAGGAGLLIAAAAAYFLLG